MHNQESAIFTDDNNDPDSIPEDRKNKFEPERWLSHWLLKQAEDELVQSEEQLALYAEILKIKSLIGIDCSNDLSLLTPPDQSNKLRLMQVETLAGKPMSRQEIHVLRSRLNMIDKHNRFIYSSREESRSVSLKHASDILTILCLPDSNRDLALRLIDEATLSLSASERGYLEDTGPFVTGYFENLKGDDVLREVKAWNARFKFWEWWKYSQYEYILRSTLQRLCLLQVGFILGVDDDSVKMLNQALDNNIRWLKQSQRDIMSAYRTLTRSHKELSAQHVGLNEYIQSRNLLRQSDANYYDPVSGLEALRWLSQKEEKALWPSAKEFVALEPVERFDVPITFKPYYEAVRILGMSLEGVEPMAAALKLEHILDQLDETNDVNRTRELIIHAHLRLSASKEQKKRAINQAIACAQKICDKFYKIRVLWLIAYFQYKIEREDPHYSSAEHEWNQFTSPLLAAFKPRVVEDYDNMLEDAKSELNQYLS